YMIQAEYKPKFEHGKYERCASWCMIRSRRIRIHIKRVQVMDRTPASDGQQHLLGESEERYRTVLAALAEGVIVRDATGAIDTANASAERILGVAAEQLMADPQVDPRWHATREDGTLLPGDQHPSIVALKTGEPQQGVVIGVYRPDGRLVWLSTSSTPIFKAGEQRPHSVVSSFVDITRSKELEIALRRQALTFETIHEGVILTDANGIITDWNPGAEAIFGYSKPEMVGRSVALTHAGNSSVQTQILETIARADRWSG